MVTFTILSSHCHAGESMCTEEQHKEQKEQLDKIIKHLEKRQPDRIPIAISATYPWIVDNRGRRYTYLYSPLALLLNCGDFGAFTLPANVWTNFNMPPQTRVTAVGQTSNVTVLLFATDDVIPSTCSVSLVDGVFTTTITAGVATDTVIKASSGYLNSVLVTATGTNALNIFDNASGHSGTQIGLVPANASVNGVPFTFKNPAANGITVQGNSNNPGVTISWS